MSYQADYTKLFPSGNGAKKNDIPARTERLINAYIETGSQPGGFLKAVFENDLMSAVLQGDADNRACLKQILKFLINNAPSQCYGSKEAYAEWRAKGGETG